jgi:hypothetical protein
MIKFLGVGVRENGKLLLNRFGVSVWDDKKVMELEHNDSCT